MRRSVGKRFLRHAGMWMTTQIIAGKPLDSPARTSRRTEMPPAEAPMTIMRGTISQSAAGGGGSDGCGPVRTTCVPRHDLVLVRVRCAGSERRATILRHPQCGADGKVRDWVAAS